MDHVRNHSDQTKALTLEVTFDGKSLPGVLPDSTGRVGVRGWGEVRKGKKKSQEHCGFGIGDCGLENSHFKYQITNKSKTSNSNGVAFGGWPSAVWQFGI